MVHMSHPQELQDKSRIPLVVYLPCTVRRDSYFDSYLCARQTAPAVREKTSSLQASKVGLEHQTLENDMRRTSPFPSLSQFLASDAWVVCTVNGQQSLRIHLSPFEHHTHR
mmetsp:Transcript_144917/g.252737  ORF Transcript_144917/g.252737 Transcript_144917/m.252737 type:complete len:111 (+) Transcript_144917:997-1329(+)